MPQNFKSVFTSKTWSLESKVEPVSRSPQMRMPELSNFYCHPGKAGASPADARSASTSTRPPWVRRFSTPRTAALGAWVCFSLATNRIAFADPARGRRSSPALSTIEPPFLRSHRPCHSTQQRALVALRQARPRLRSGSFFRQIFSQHFAGVRWAGRIGRLAHRTSSGLAHNVGVSTIRLPSGRLAFHGATRLAG